LTKQKKYVEIKFTLIKTTIAMAKKGITLGVSMNDLKEEQKKNKQASEAFVVKGSWEPKINPSRRRKRK